MDTTEDPNTLDERDGPHDVVVIGGGAAGLGGALALGRARRSVLVLDAGQPRNAPAAHAHNYLGREGVPPLELLADGREEITRYGAHVQSATVVAARATDDGFRVELAGGRSVAGRRLLVATGLVDELPADVDGLAERWGRDVLHCPYCHGWEVRDQVLAVLATGPGAVEQALMFRQWSRDVVLLLHTADDPSDAQREQLAARDITVVDGDVTAVQVADDRLVGLRLSSGRVVDADAVVVSPTFTTRAAALADLGLRPVAWPTASSTGTAVEVGPGGATDVPGVWAAGNATDLYAGVLQAAAAGVTAGAAINADLVAEDTRRAVAARRAATSTPAERFWEEHYQRAVHEPAARRMNPVVAGVGADLAPGRALDLGCGEGGDALGLAGLGWQVTAVDVSETVLRRVRDRARAAGLLDRIRVEQHDLTRTVPDGVYDLVSAAFLQSPVDFDRAVVLRAVARSVAPGGVLLLVEHGSTAPWSWNQDPDARFATPAELLAELELPAEQWRTERLDTPRREASGPGGQVATVTDTVVAVRRLPTPNAQEGNHDGPRRQPPTTSPEHGQAAPRTGEDERSTLLGFLDYLRDGIAAKLEGAPEPQVRTAGVPSGTTLLGLITHVTAVERFVFMGEDADSWAQTFRPAPGDTIDGVLAGYRDAVHEANQRILACTDLSLPAAPSPRRGSLPSMRWALTHMIEETGRHAGHADILREQIDGSVGR